MKNKMLVYSSPETEKYYEETSLEYRKEQGQYFTNKEICSKSINLLSKDFVPKNILEPSAGSGEFIFPILDKYKETEIDCVEMDKKLSSILKIQFQQDKNISIFNEDFLKKQFNKKYDLIIGNPPYFELKPNNLYKEDFKEIISGRTNIYSLFIGKCIDLLNPGGCLVFVVPTSMNNGKYFDKLRKYIVKNTNIINLLPLSEDLFDNAQQNVQILILKKEKNTGNFLFKKEDILIFSKEPKKLYKAFEGKMSLKEMGFKAKTGSLVWNQNKEKLTNNDNETLLLWAHNITKNGIELNNDKNKPQFIIFDKQDPSPSIATNRIIGNSKRLNAVIVTEENYIAENHVNIIYKDPEMEMKRYRHIKYLTSIMEQLNSPETIEILFEISGNTQISKTELENLVPFSIPK